MSTSTPNILVDTDVGLDDAMALLMLLQCHRRGLLTVVAITTTHGNTTLDNVNKNILRVLHAVNMLQIPVFAGARSALIQPFLAQVDPPFHGFDGFGDSNLPHPDPTEHIQQKSAVINIIETVEQYKDTLHILALGPLTNLALAKKIKPDVFSNIAGLHIMGGNTKGIGNNEPSPCGEFNFSCDPEAAQIVLSRENKEESVYPVYITPWETCYEAVHLSTAYRHELGEGTAPEALLMNRGEAKNLARKKSQWITCDQLATAWMIDQLLGDKILPSEDRVGYSSLASAVEKHDVTIELQGRFTRGQMVLDRLKQIAFSLPVTILTGVNETLYKRYLNMAFGKNF